MTEVSAYDCVGEWCERATPQQARRLNRIAVLRAQGIHHKSLSMPLLYKASNNISIEALERSLTRLVLAHESLRYSFHRHDGVLHVTSVEEARFAIKEVDADSRMAAAMRTGDFTEFDIRDLGEFGAESPCRLEAYVLDAGSDGYYLLFLLDHLIADRVACRTFVSEVGRLYREETVGVPEDPARPGLVDERGRAALRRISESHESIEISEHWRDVREIMRSESLLAPVRLPVSKPLSERCEKLTCENRLLPFSNRELTGASARSGVTPFMAFMASVDKAFADIPERPGYAYVYPSFREFMNLGDSIGWYAGTAVIEMSGQQSSFEDHLSHSRAGVLKSITEGWSVYERMHSDDVPIRHPSLSLQYVADEEEYVPLDLHHESCEPIRIVSSDTGYNSGRISMTLHSKSDSFYIETSFEAGRFPTDLTDHLVEETCGRLTDFVNSGRPGGVTE